MAAFGLPAAYAASAGTYVPGEIGFVPAPTVSTRTREEVRQEFLAFRANPVTAEGGRYVGGEAGFAYTKHTHEFVDGHWVATGGIGHNPKPSLNWTTAEHRQFVEQYPAN